MVTLFKMYYQLFKMKHLKKKKRVQRFGEIWMHFLFIFLMFFIVFQSSPWTAVSCLTKERQTVEYMLSSQTNLSHSTFTAKWVQVGERQKNLLYSEALTWVIGQGTKTKRLSRQIATETGYPKGQTMGWISHSHYL